MKLSSHVRLRHIRAFMALYQTRSVTRAAEDLGTVQPAVSRTLRELETELGQPLFERRAQGLLPTPAGETFYRHMNTGMALIERGIEQVKGFDTSTSVAIGILPNVARTLIPTAVMRFKEVSPDVDLRVIWATIPEQLAALQRGALDFMVGRLVSVERMAGVSFEQLYTEPLLFVVRAGHPLAEMDAPTLAMIDSHIVVVPNPETIIRIELDRYTFAMGIPEFTRKIETVSFDVTRAILAQSDAVGFMPLGAVRQELAEGSLVRLPLAADDLIGPVGMSFISGRGLSPAAEALADIIREAARTYREA